jgi:O-6-methylguanine DNA methyltransferase
MNTEHTLTTSAPVVGVKTTRIYCRPVCRPGRAPRPENCVPFADVASARAAGYRPCKQCRPDDPPAPRTVVRYGTGPSPVGTLFLAATERGVCALYMLDFEDPSPALSKLRRDVPGAAYVEDQAVTEAYLPRVEANLTDGRPCDDIPLDLRGTPFQLRVWKAISDIPRGETTSYGGIAAALGLPPGAARAVGTACGANPVSLLVPCHRVLRAGGGLGGYGGGLDRKRALLEMEGVRLPYEAGSETVLTAVP